MPQGTYIRTDRSDIDELFQLVASFLEKDVMELTIDGKQLSGFRTPDAKSLWIRDHSDMLRGGRYFHPDVTSAVEHFAETQSATGRVFDYFTTFPEKLPCERENWTKYVRVPVEADVEYRFVKGAHLAWQASGDNDWISRMLPSMEKALQYIRNHKWYWDSKHGLVKRAYTIDTWDFAYSAGTHDWLQFQFNEHTFWGIMHGDNSGYFEAYRIMAQLYARIGDEAKSDYWREQAAILRENMNATCWNGRFYTHFVKLNPVDIAGVDESQQLSLSNPMNINRGVASHDMAVAIIEEYRRRREVTGAFAEWFSIDPPFPDGIFGDEKLIGGAYVNGGIMPLVGGELAKAAFDHGYEDYGVNILTRYHSLISEKQETYLWYFPDGTPASVEASTSPEAEPTDGWGSSAMLYALTDGLAGIEDLGKGFDAVSVSPRWPAADVANAEVQLTYASSGKHIGYDYHLSDAAIDVSVACEAANMKLHVLLPADRRVDSVTVSGVDAPFQVSEVESSRYVDFAADVDGHVDLIVHLSQQE
ncbi:MAG: hypothetical protein JSW51_00380 [Gemmatimonadota bacterium]|nr:MAG: hypothetical protein JSW51_00380 [Gemmatimonadota bacterium]